MHACIILYIALLHGYYMMISRYSKKFPETRGIPRSIECLTCVFRFRRCPRDPHSQVDTCQQCVVCVSTISNQHSPFACQNLTLGEVWSDIFRFSVEIIYKLYKLLKRNVTLHVFQWSFLIFFLQTLSNCVKFGGLVERECWTDNFKTTCWHLPYRCRRPRTQPFPHLFMSSVYK